MTRARTVRTGTALLMGLSMTACFNPGSDQGTAFETFMMTSAGSTGPTSDTELPGESTAGDATAGTSASSTMGPADGTTSESGPGSSGAPGECGNGEVEAGEACDDAGESATCNDDCTAAVCGDGILNVTAGETCDDGEESATCDADCTEVACGDGTPNAAAGEECDDAGESAACDVDCTAAMCGDSVVNPLAGEECDDGNGMPGDGCEGCLVVVACAPGAVLLGVNPEGTMAVCDDPTNTVCEEDAETLCPAGWGLCSREQHHARNDGFDFPVGGAVVVVGEIYCRSGSGAGHYTLGPYDGVTNLDTDPPLNCGYGSSRDSCVSMFGCNETQVSALCCAPSPLCGNGVVDAPEELCDDGNASEIDDCLDSCAWRRPSDHGMSC